MSELSAYTAAHKVPTYQIYRMTNADPDFYAVLGPLLARREVVKDLGAPIWDDDDKVWQVAITEQREVLGMIALRGVEVCSFYVVPGSRGFSVGYALLYRVMHGHVGPMTATASEASRDLFASAGFAETGRRGRYHLMRKD